MKKILVLIPCYNEEDGIGKVIEDIPIQKLKEAGFETQVIVIDNNSSDKTSDVARKHGAKVILEEKRGKGYAMRAGFEVLPKDTDYVVMLDGNNTYKAKEIFKLVEPLYKDLADVAIGSRLEGEMKPNSLSSKDILINKFCTFLIRSIYHSATTDIFTGFMAFKSKVVNELKPTIKSKGFEIETELNIKIAKSGYKLLSVPITYDVRIGKQKINGFTAAPGIIYTFLRNLNWTPN